MRTAVVLPAPLGPSSPNTVPAGTAKSMPSSATTWPNRSRSPATASAGSLLPPPWHPVTGYEKSGLQRDYSAVNSTDRKLEREVQPECVVEPANLPGPEDADRASDPLDRDRSDLLRLRFRV